jgi:hypothetical protein
MPDADGTFTGVFLSCTFLAGSTHGDDLLHGQTSSERCHMRSTSSALVDMTLNAHTRGCAGCTRGQMSLKGRKGCMLGRWLLLARTRSNGWLGTILTSNITTGAEGS